MRVLVTGAAGLIGSNFVRYRVQPNPDDHGVALDLLTYAGNGANLDDVGAGVPFVHGDVGDREALATVLGQHAIDLVVHDGRVGQTVVEDRAWNS